MKRTPLPRTATAVLAAAVSALLIIPTATAAEANPMDRLTAITHELTDAESPGELHQALADLPPVLEDLRGLTDSQGVLHLLVDAQALAHSAASALSPQIAAAALPGLLNLIRQLMTQQSAPQRPLLPQLPQLPLAIP
ncbi:hypothetical protein V5P93_002618 [Actinokineospora auranticolor]|uniref:hypothetical protein n=1 Tax=Actinokineospora auranticolor TaxID=155976 RepID=UPI0011B0A87D|nr:hypothetical protein [Actinokineospora auranticolor]